MPALYDLISEDPSTRDNFVNGVSWHLIEDAIQEKIAEQGDAPFSTTAEAWEFYWDNKAHAARMDEVGGIGNDATLGEVVEAFAAVTWRLVAEEEAQQELSTLQSLVDFAEGEGFTVEGIATSCKLGWMPHESEEDWPLKNGETANLHTWRNVEGEPGARYLVSVELDGGTVWVELSKDEDEAAE